MAVVSRLNTFNKLVGCKRKPKESLSTFVSRLWGFAADNLMHAGTSSSSQTAEMLAIILLNNFSLQDETLTADKLELIRIAETREYRVDKDGPIVRACHGAETLRGNFLRCTENLRLLIVFCSGPFWYTC
jgi:hypothetical protein